MLSIWKTLLIVALIGGFSLDLATSSEQTQDDHANENTTAYRLPENLIPKEYFIRLSPLIGPDNFSFDGQVRIVAQVLKSTSHVILHADQIKVNSTTVSLFLNEKEKLNLEILKTEYETKYDFFNITLKSPLKAGTNISIDLTYSGILRDDMTGFFRNWYRQNNERRWILATQMGPVYARRVFPCFDEPALKAIFHISVACPKNYSALSNMPIKFKTESGLTVFEKTPPMSTYLLAIIVSDFESLSINDEKNRTYAVWTSSGLMHQLPYSLPIASQSVKFFESHLKVPFPLPKIDLVALPDFTGVAMENWGLVTYSEKLMLYDAKYTPLRLKQLLRNAISHETAHHWFGNLVTPKRWDYLWLSEGIAHYFQYHAHDDAISSWNLESLFVVNEMHEMVFAVDALNTTHPVTQNAYSTSEIKSMYDMMAYHKPACLLRMLEKLLGQKMFYHALNRYIVRNEFSVGTPELLFEAFDEEIKLNRYKLNETVSDVMTSWTLQSGFPVVRADFDGDVVTLSQQRFFLKPDQRGSDNSIWRIPISWTLGSHPDFEDTKTVTWLKDDVTTLTIPNASNDWVIFNIQQTGFYRVNYDGKMWRRIINVLKSEKRDSIHEINRAAIIDDLFNLARAEMLDYSLLLDATLYLTEETNFIPWKSAFTGFTYLNKKLAGNSDLYQTFKTYLISLLEPHYARLTFDEKPEEQELDVLFRELVVKWLCNVDHEDCVAKSKEAFEKSQLNDSYVISPNEQGTVYCTAVKHGSDQVWDYLWKKFESSNYALERFTILSALACSQNSSRLEQLLHSAFEPEIGVRKEIISDLITAVAENSRNGPEVTLNFMKQNFQKINDYMGNDGVVNSIPVTVSELLSTEDLVEKFSTFVKEDGKDLSSIDETLQFALQNSVSEFNWFRRNSPKISDWFEKNFASKEYKKY